MLRGIRQASSNRIGKAIMTIVMGVLIVSFGVWGIADIFKGFGQSALAKVGSTEITTEQFRQTYTERLQQVGRQAGRPLTPDQARAFGLDRQVLRQMVTDAALDEDARRMGLTISEPDIMRAITDDPNFRGTNNQFDAQRFTQLIRQIGYTEQRFLAEQRKSMLRRQIVGSIGAGVTPSATLVEQLVRFRNEERSIDYLKLTAAQAGDIAQPSPEAIAAYYDDNKLQFRAPEYRKIAYVIVTPDDIAKWTEISDADARKAYDLNLAKVSTPETRQVSQIVFPSLEEAKAARDKITAGASFDDIAKERGLSASDINLGTIAKSAIVDPAAAEAAFALKSGDVSDPVKGTFGAVLLKVGAITPGNTPDFAAVVPQIKRDLARERAVGRVAELQAKMEDERGGGANVVEAAQKLGLTATTIEAVDRSGRAPDGNAVAGLPANANVVAQAFNAAVGVEPEAIPYNSGQIWFDVLGITAARDRPLDEVKAQVETRWREQQVSDRLRAKAMEIVTAVQGGATLAAQAQASGVSVSTAGPFKRDATAGDIPAPVVETAFRTAKDAAARAQSGETWFVFRVTAITTPPVDSAAAEVTSLRDNLQRVLAEEQVSQYIAAVEKQVGTSINQAAVAQATGANSGN